MAGIFSRLHEAPHSYHPSLTSFQEINLDVAKRDLDLERRAELRAADNEPALGGTTLDPVENEIIDFIESTKGRDRQILADHLEVYAERIASLNIEGRLADIDIVFSEAKAGFQRIIQLGLDELHSRRRYLLDRETDLKNFREDNKRRETAYYPALPKKIFLFGLIAVLLLREFNL